MCTQEVTIRGGGLKHVACAEDEDFIQALDKMMLENLQVCTSIRLNPRTCPFSPFVTDSLPLAAFAFCSSGVARR